MSLQFNPFTGTFDVTTKGDTGTVAAAGDGTNLLPGIAFANDLNTGIYRPGADQLAISTGGTGRLFVDASGNVNIGNPLGYSETLGVRGTFASQVTNVVNRITEAGSVAYWGTVTNHPLAFQTNGQERMRLDTSGRLGIGTTSPSSIFHCVGSKDATNVTIGAPLSTVGGGAFANFSQLLFENTSGANANAAIRAYGNIWNSAGSALSLMTSSGSAPVDRLYINSAGQVGIGTTSPGTALDVVGAVNSQGNSAAIVHYQLRDSGAAADEGIWRLAQTLRSTKTLAIGLTQNDAGSVAYAPISISRSGASIDSIAFATSTGSERARIDSSGRLLVGTSTARLNWFNGASLAPQVQIEGAGLGARLSIVRNDASANGHGLILGKTRGSSYEIVSAEDPVGYVSFQGADGAELVEAARIETVIDGTPGANDMPGRLVFSTSADGAASPTERLRITSAGVLQIADAGNIAVGTTTGTKIGTATTQKLGFYNATPVVQPTAVADITTTATTGTLPTADGSVTIADAAAPTVIELLEYCVELEAKLETALSRLRSLGLIAT